ncbi:hypothetical protein COLO4_19061 [Corchorus olitorius]|uniref:Uncharacterized protein n=1 Tax=Corchorus olitorius TaxID=93759 RepID=A0A1R3J6X5_9ROSI|nr:hypothetical protein COLO4_19061 [Corchorus olitorius]
MVSGDFKDMELQQSNCTMLAKIRVSSRTGENQQFLDDRAVQEMVGHVPSLYNHAKKAAGILQDAAIL